MRAQIARRWTPVWDPYPEEMHPQCVCWMLGQIQRASAGRFLCKTATHRVRVGSATVGAQWFELDILSELQELSLWSFHTFLSLLFVSHYLRINLPSPAGLIRELGHLKMTQLLHHGSSRSPHPNSGPPVKVGAFIFDHLHVPSQIHRFYCLSLDWQH